MKNGDLRAAVWAFLPPRNPNCTSYMRLFADGRDPPLPTALHVSTVRCRGINRVRGARIGDRCALQGRVAFLTTLVTRRLMFRLWWCLRSTTSLNVSRSGAGFLEPVGQPRNNSSAIQTAMARFYAHVRLKTPFTRDGCSQAGLQSPARSDEQVFETGGF